MNRLVGLPSFLRTMVQHVPDGEASLNPGDVWVLSSNSEFLGLAMVAAVKQSFVLAWPVTLPNEPAYFCRFGVETRRSAKTKPQLLRWPSGLSPRRSSVPIRCSWLVHLSRVRGRAVGTEHGLHLIPHLVRDDRLVRSGVGDALVADAALVVRVCQHPVYGRLADGPSWPSRCRGGGQPTRHQLLMELARGPVAGGEHLEGPPDQPRPFVGVRDGAYLAPDERARRRCGSRWVPSSRCRLARPSATGP